MKPHIYFDGEKWQMVPRPGVVRAFAPFACAEDFVRMLNERRAMAYFTK